MDFLPPAGELWLFITAMGMLGRQFLRGIPAAIRESMLTWAVVGLEAEIAAPGSFEVIEH
ncbi:MAG: hypothetical protein JO159_10385 [Acidobacteria bacterium]|nr:hypothetical protein [Acidobacteriota bacterium]